MMPLLSILKFSTRFYPVKKEIIKYSKTYLFEQHVLPVISEISDLKIYKEGCLSLKDAVLSDAFKNGLIDYFLKPNGYILNAKDIAVSLNMGVYGHSNKTFDSSALIDAAFYITKNIKDRIYLDENFKNILKEIGKKVEDINYDINRKEVESIMDDKKILFKNYFGLYDSPQYGEKVIIYYPGYGKSWIEWKKEDSLEISFLKHDIPRGFFLMGFEYKFKNHGWLETAIRTDEKEYFNPINRNGEELIWSQ